MADEKEIIVRVKGDTSDVETSIDNVGKKLGEIGRAGERSFTTYKSAIKDATNEAAKMEAQFGKNSAEFRNAATKVSELKDQFTEFNTSINSFNPDNKFQSLISITRGASTAIQGMSGAMNFMGVDSDNAAQSIAKLQGLMAFTDALGSVDDIKNGFKDFGNVIQGTTVFQRANAISTSLATAAMKLFGKSADTTSTGFKTLKGAIIGTGIGALVVGLGLLISNFDSVKKAVLNLIPGLASVASFIGGLVDSVTDFVGITSEAERALAKLETATARQNDDTANRIKILEAQGGKEKEIHLERVNQIERETNLLREKLKVEGKLSDDQSKEFRALKTEREAEDIKEQKRLADVEKKSQDDAKKKADENERKNKEAADKRKALSDKEAARLKAIEDNKIEQAKKTDDLLYELSQARISNEFTKQQNAIAKEAQDKEDGYINDFNKKLISESDLQKNLLAVREIAAIKQNELLDKKRKEDADKALVDAQKSIDDTRSFLQEAFDEKKTVAETTLIKTEIDNKVDGNDTPEQAKQKLDNINKDKLALEKASFEAEKVRLQDHHTELENLVTQHGKRLTDITQSNEDAKANIDKAARDAKIQNLQKVGQAIGTIGNIIGQHTVAGKAMAIAQATIDTYAGANKAFAEGGTMGIIQGAVIIAAGIANVKKIIDTKVPGKSDSSSSQVPQMSTAPIINSTQLNNNNTPQDVRVINQQSGSMRAYITQRDLDTNTERQDFLNNLGTIR